MTGLEVRQIRLNMGLDQKQLGELMWCGRTAVTMWEKQGLKHGPTRKLLDLLFGLHKLKKSLTLD